MNSKNFKRIVLIITIGGFLLIPSINNLFAANSIRIAILDFDANGTSKYAASAASEFISTEMAKKKELTVVERKKIGAVLNEQGFQQTVCSEQDCAVEMGKLLSARKILMGTLTKTGDFFIITAKSVDVETGRVEFAESEKFKKEENLELASKILAVKLVNKIADTSYTTPLRTYQQDESRNRLGIGVFYRYGIIKDVNVPVVQIENSSLKIVNSKMDIQNQSVIFSPFFEFTDNIGVRFDFKYIYSQFKDETGSTDYENSGTVTRWFDMDPYSMTSGYGLGLNLLLIYPVDGFKFYVNPGLGVDKYFLSKSESLIYSYEDPSAPFPGDMFQNLGSYKLSSDMYSYLCKIEAGFSIYVSRYVDLNFSAGVDFHLFSKLISEVKINDETSELIIGTPPAVEQTRYANIENKFKGNFPPEYYAQAGVVLRLF